MFQDKPQLAEEVHTPVVEQEPPSRKGQIVHWAATGLGALGGGLYGWLGNRLIVCVLVGAVVGAVLGIIARVLMLIWPVVRAIWHWSVELVTLTVAVTCAATVARLTGSWWWALLLLAPVAGVAAWPAGRRKVWGAIGCVVVRHRLRVCFAAFLRARNRIDPALAPIILTARPTPAGERVWLWLRTGFDANDLAARADRIAVACWASKVQVTVSRRFAALVRLDVSRRDPLRLVVTSPLAQQVPGQRPPTPQWADHDNGAPLVLDLVDVTPEMIIDAPVGRRR